MPQISRNERWINNKTAKKNLQAEQKKNKKQSHRDTYTTCQAQQLLDKLQIELPGRASDAVPSDDRTSASNDNTNYHFVSNPKIKRMLIVQCSGVATATSS
jgi:hypothetical protein